MIDDQKKELNDYRRIRTEEYRMFESKLTDFMSRLDNKLFFIEMKTNKILETEKVMVDMIRSAGTNSAMMQSVSTTDRHKNNYQYFLGSGEKVDDMVDSTNFEASNVDDASDLMNIIKNSLGKISTKYFDLKIDVDDKQKIISNMIQDMDKKEKIAEQNLNK